MWTIAYGTESNCGDKTGRPSAINPGVFTSLDYEIAQLKVRHVILVGSKPFCEQMPEK